MTMPEVLLALVVVLGLGPAGVDEVEAAMHLGRLSSVVVLFRRTEHLQLAQTTSGSVLHVVLVGGDRLEPTVVDLVQRARSSALASQHWCSAPRCPAS